MPALSTNLPRLHAPHGVCGWCERRKQITDAAQASLARERVLSTAASADAVAAIAALQGLDSAGALQEFLAGRRAWLQGHLDACAAAMQPGEVSQALVELSHAIQLAVSQVRRSAPINAQPLHVPWWPRLERKHLRVQSFWSTAAMDRTMFIES